MTDRKEPGWSALLPDTPSELGNISNAEWRDRASAEWNVIMDELEEAGTFTPGNAHMVVRLTLSRVRYERAAAEVFRLGGPVTQACNGQEMLRQWHVEMRQADADATTAEMELGIPPRRRGAVTKAPAKKKAASKASLYLVDAKKKPANG